MRDHRYKFPNKYVLFVLISADPMKFCIFWHFIWVLTVCQSTLWGVSGIQRVKIEPLLDRQQNAIQMAFCWRPDSGPLLYVDRVNLDACLQGVKSDKAQTSHLSLREWLKFAILHVASQLLYFQEKEYM